MNDTLRDAAEPSECDADDLRFFEVTRTGCNGRLWLDSRLVGPVSRFGANVTREVLRLDVSESELTYKNFADC